MKRNLPPICFCVFTVAVMLLLGAASSGVPASALTISLSTRQTALPVTNFIAVSAGSGHTCGLTDRGGVMCWGANYVGQLGDGTRTDRYTPVYVSGLTSGVVAVSAGATHTCALVATGGVKCWGNNNRGQLGDGTKIDRRTPVDAVGLTGGVAAIEAGGLDTCAITTGGGAKCWGSNNRGRLGDGTTIDRWTPVDVVGLSSGVIAIRTNDAGGAHTCAVLTGGGVKCWGNNESGQLGDGSGTDQLTSVDVNSLSSGVIDVTLGTWHTCAALATGGVKCWGDNSSGQLGDGTTTNQPTPVDVIYPIGTAMRVTAGYGHSCALLNNGGIQCWGYNFSGELGDGTTINRLTPVDVIGLAGEAVTLSAGGAHTCASFDSGQAQCWGDNVVGQLGNGQAINFTTPTANLSLTSGVTGIGLGSYHACALANGGVQCWGDNGFGQLGAGATVTQTPVGVSGLSSGVTALAAGSLHTCAVENGGAQCWGDNRAGQLGDGTTISHTTPISVTGLISGVTAMSAGWLHTCALTEAGGVQCWGEGVAGGCATSTSQTPVDVCGLTEGVTAIASGYTHACALLTTGGIKCWGNNGSGQLGDGTTIGQPTPVDVIGLPMGARAIAAGLVHTCAILLDGTVRCWGNNAYGQLSDGTVSSVEAISAGDGHTCTITANGGLQCWGYNFYGQLGDGTLNNSAAPRQVIGLTSGVTTVEAGYEHTCAAVNGGLMCWGNNEHGMIGAGSLSYSPVPVEVIRPNEWHVFVPLVVRPALSFHASFTAQPVSGFVPLQVNFTNTSTGPYTSLLWDFGDNVTSTLPNPSHVYWDASVYTPTLYASDGEITATTSITIDVFPAQELIVNGGFETDDAWQFNSAPEVGGYTATVAHSGQRSVKLGTLPPAPIQYGYAVVSQPVSIPTGTTHARLSFWYWPRRQDGTGPFTHSRQFVDVLDSHGQLLEKLIESSADAPAWQYAEFDVTKHAGRTITIEFGVYHDGNALYGKRTAMFVDDVSLLVAPAYWPVSGLAADYPFKTMPLMPARTATTALFTGPR